jgi:primosomal protein N' (replication factor Y)
MGENKTFYYLVSLVLPATWKQNSYTYSYGSKLANGSIVVCPFGKSEKIGIVVSEAAKPDYATKDLIQVLNLELPINSLAMLEWMNDYYPGFGGVNTQLLVPSFLKKLPKKNTEEIVQEETLIKLPTLTSEQTNAYKKIRQNKTKNIVLHGITGSGKTRVYSELVKNNIEKNKNSLILYPEISLTSQLLESLTKAFGKQKILVYHSRQTTAEQRKTWLKILNSKDPLIIIGPRSALFLPFSNLGTVIVDEAHDSSYKQDNGSRYSGILAAAALSKQHSAQLILGSATPPVQETEQILSKGGVLVCMHSLAKTDTENQKSFDVIDMTKKNNKSKNYQLSKRLISEIEKSIKNGKQSLLFLNKRGTARMLLCENCSWHAECPKCEMPLTHHHDSFTLQCHVCGYSKKSVISCPECSSALSLKNPGIKAIEEEIKNLFPQSKIARFDSDNKKKDTFQANYESIKSGGADIIIGTQLITKGLDLPLLDTVGILEADSALLLPDFTSEERAFQQLTQVSGRVGRGHSVGKVIIQTYQPNSYIFPFVIEQNWHGFFETELDKRKENHYPPLTYAMKIWTTKNTRENALKSISKIIEKINSMRILGPAPSFYERAAGKYSWQIIVLSSSRKKLSEIAGNLPNDVYFDLDPISFL